MSECKHEWRMNSFGSCRCRICGEAPPAKNTPVAPVTTPVNDTSLGEFAYVRMGDYYNPAYVERLESRLSKLEAAAESTIKRAKESAERSRYEHPETSCGSCHLDFMQEIVDALAAAREGK